MRRHFNIAPTPTCPGCRVELRKLVSLGAPDSSGAADLDGFSGVVRDQAGRYYTWNHGRHSILVYDSTGGFIRQLGRQGQGPGEFRGAGGVIRAGVNDSLFVLSSRELSVWTPDGKLARTVRLPSFAYSAHLIANGQLLVNASIRTPEGAGFPLHLIDHAGDVLRSFGAATAELRPQCMACQIRVTSLATDQTSVWTALPDEYVLEKWSVNGRIERRLHVTGSSWFPHFTPEQRVNMRDVLSPITDLRQDASGLLWVRGSLPEAIPVAPQGPQRGVTRGRPDLRIGTVLDVIDTKSGRLLVSKRFEDLTLHVMDGGLAYAPKADENGIVTIDILRVTLRTP